MKEEENYEETPVDLHLLDLSEIESGLRKPHLTQIQFLFKHRG